MSTPETLKRERKCSTEKNTAALCKGSKRICLPMARENYDQLIVNPVVFRQFLDPMIAQYPELFPRTIGSVTYKGQTP